jgi:hypothetical protein
LCGFGIFIENVADAQEKSQLRPYIILFIVGLTLSVGGYWLIKNVIKEINKAFDPPE